MKETGETLGDEVASDASPDVDAKDEDGGSIATCDEASGTPSHVIVVRDYAGELMSLLILQQHRRPLHIRTWLGQN